MTSTVTEIGANTLAITVDQQSLFYGIFDPNHKLLQSDRITFADSVDVTDYTEVLRNHPALHNDYRNVKISVKTSKSQVRPFPSTTTVKTRNGVEIIDKVPSQSTNIAWNGASNLLAALAEVFPDRPITNYGTVLAHYIYPTVEDVVAIHIDKSTLHVASYQDDQLQLYKMYKAVTKEDYLYLIMACYRITGQDPCITKLRIAGDLYKHSDLYHLLKKYIHHIDFISPELLRLKTSLPDSVKHRYFDLFATSLCVS